MATMSAHFCYDCCFKHLSSARILYNEICNGYFNVDHISYLVGNMALAEVHIFELHPDVAEWIREQRKVFWDGILTGDVQRPDFEGLLERVYDKALELGLDDEDMEKEIVGGSEEEEKRGEGAIN